MYSIILTLSVLTLRQRPATVSLSPNAAQRRSGMTISAVDALVPAIATQGQVRRRFRTHPSRGCNAIRYNDAEPLREAYGSSSRPRRSRAIHRSQDKVLQETTITSSQKAEAPQKPLSLKAALRKLADELALQMKAVDQTHSTENGRYFLLKLQPKVIWESS